MEGMYAETSISRKNGITQYLQIFGIILVASIIFIYSMGALRMQLFGILIVGIVIFLLYYCWLRMKVDYEYVFCDGQIDFDIIYNGSKRKNLLKVDLEESELMAAADDEQIKSFSNIDQVKDFSSRDKSVTPYALIVKKNGKIFKVLFEPNDLMLEKIRYKIPRKLKLNKKIEL